MRRLVPSFAVSLLATLLVTPSPVLAWDMVLLPKTGAPDDPGGVDWPDPRFVKGEYAPVIFDALTGLMWLVDAQTLGPFADELGLVALTEAVEELNTSEAGVGFFDWRVPNIRELMSLNDWSLSCSGYEWLESEGFENVGSEWFLSSTDPQAVDAYLWRFGCEAPEHGGEGDLQTFAWAVRTHTRPRSRPIATGQHGAYAMGDDGWWGMGAQWNGDKRWLVLACGGDGPEDDAIIDTVTGYLWARDVEAVEYDDDYGVMKDRAEGLTLCDLGGWRMPDINELQSLLDLGEQDQRRHFVLREFVNVPDPELPAGGPLMLAPSTTPAFGYDPSEGFAEGFGFDDRGAHRRVFSTETPEEPYDPDDRWVLAVNPTHGTLTTDDHFNAFESVAVGGIAKSQTVTLENAGFVPLQIFSMAIEGTGAAHFDLDDTTCDAAVLWDHDYERLDDQPYVATCDITISYAPTEVGAHAATLVVQSTDPDELRLDLDGTAFEDDGDGDGVGDFGDNCPDVGNGDQADEDADGVGEACDPCPEDEDNGCLWEVEVAQQQEGEEYGSYGLEPSLAVDERNVLHVAHQAQRQDRWQVRYSRSPALHTWDNEVVADSVGKDDRIGFETGIGLDAMRRPQLVWLDDTGELMRAAERRTLGGWGYHVLGHTKRRWSRLATAVTSSPRGDVFAPWVSYTDDGIDLWLSAKGSGGSWTGSRLGLSEDPSLETLCATTDRGGDLYIAYGMAPNELRLMSFNDGARADERVDYGGTHCAIAVDAGGTVHLAYIGWELTGERWLVYARRAEGGGWHRQRVEQLLGNPASVSLALTADARALITFRDEANTSVVAHRERGRRGGWLRSRIPAELFLQVDGRAPSALDAVGNLHVVFRGRGSVAGSGSLMHATRPVVWPEGADMQVTLVQTPDTGILGGGLVHEIRLVNRGPEVARDVVLTFDAGGTIPVFIGEGCALEGGVLVCRLDELAVRDERVIRVVVMPDKPGPLRSEAEVTTRSVDPVQANNRAEGQATVLESTLGPMVAPLVNGRNEATPVGIEPQAHDVGMLTVGLWAGEREAIDVEGLTVAVAGSGDDRELTRLRVVEDTDGNGAADAGEPLLASVDRPFASDDASLALAFDSALRVAAGESTRLVLVGDFDVQGAVWPLALTGALAGLLLVLGGRRRASLAALFAITSCGDGGGATTDTAVVDVTDTVEVVDTIADGADGDTIADGVDGADGEVDSETIGDVADAEADVPPVITDGLTFRLIVTGVDARSATFGVPVEVSGLPVQGALVFTAP